MDFTLTGDEKSALIQTARGRIRTELFGEDPEYPEASGVLNEICGAFVTLHITGSLRGCIGNIVGRLPLITTVKEMAHAAAFEDPRFPPLTKGEWNMIDIEISVLSPLHQAAGVNEIEVGKHGIFMKKGYHSGVLLPQVPIEQGWDRDRFVQHTCLKAGLPPDAWKDPAMEIYLFTAIVFGEKDI